MKNFYIIGMPRCRSLWFAHLLTVNKVHCFHERLSKISLDNKQVMMSNQAFLDNLL